MQDYNTQRPHSGKVCLGKTPMQTFVDNTNLAKEHYLADLAKTIYPAQTDISNNVGVAQDNWIRENKSLYLDSQSDNFL
jgi:hypothetical protein